MAHSFPKGLPLFYITVYQIVDDPSLDPFISWGKSNNSFVVWDLINLKSVEFGGMSFSRFFYELHYHGFRRIKGPGRLEFGHDDFVRGQPQLLRKMMVKAERKRARSKARKARRNEESLLQNLQI